MQVDKNKSNEFELDISVANVVEIARPSPPGCLTHKYDAASLAFLSVCHNSISLLKIKLGIK